MFVVWIIDYLVCENRKSIIHFLYINEKTMDIIIIKLKKEIKKNKLLINYADMTLKEKSILIRKTLEMERYLDWWISYKNYIL